MFKVNLRFHLIRNKIAGANLITQLNLVTLKKVTQYSSTLHNLSTQALHNPGIHFKLTRLFKDSKLVRPWLCKWVF